MSQNVFTLQLVCNQVFNHQRLKILVACEKSGEVRRALRKLGHDAFSCDLEKADDDSPYHFKGDVLALLNMGWDIIIAFPPCTFLCVSGARWMKSRLRQKQMRRALEFVWKIYNAKCRCVCVENPIGVLSSKFRKPDQIIQPWMFGHPETKATCLWLRGLPLLKPTKNVYQKMKKRPIHLRNRIHWMSGKGRARQDARSKTFAGIAKAMASQWT